MMMMMMMIMMIRRRRRRRRSRRRRRRSRRMYSNVHLLLRKVSAWEFLCVFPLLIPMVRIELWRMWRLSMSYLRRIEGSWRLNLQPYRWGGFGIPHNVNLNSETSTGLPSTSFFRFSHQTLALFISRLRITSKSNDAVENVQNRRSFFEF